MTMHLYITCAKIFKPSSVRKAWLRFSIHVNTSQKSTMMSMSTISYTKWRYQHRYRSWLLAFVIANLMQAYRYRYDIDIKVRQRQDKTTFIRNNVATIMVCRDGEMISVWYRQCINCKVHICMMPLQLQLLELRNRYRYDIVDIDTEYKHLEVKCPKSYNCWHFHIEMISSLSISHRVLDKTFQVWYGISFKCSIENLFYKLSLDLIFFL